LGFWGFVGDRRGGQYGLESFYDRQLSGQAKISPTASASTGFWSWLGGEGKKSEEPIQSDGDSLVLSIDNNVQRRWS